jgi:hypothetical protein
MSLSAVTDFTERLQNAGLFRRPVEILTTTTETVDDTTVIRFAVKAEVIQPAQPDLDVQGDVAASTAGALAPAAGA